MLCLNGTITETKKNAQAGNVLKYMSVYLFTIRLVKGQKNTGATSDLAILSGRNKKIRLGREDKTDEIAM